eukprot:763403-Hanusia_phi.AAC.11
MDLNQHCCPRLVHKLLTGYMFLTCGQQSGGVRAGVSGGPGRRAPAAARGCAARPPGRSVHRDRIGPSDDRTRPSTDAAGRGPRLTSHYLVASWHGTRTETAMPVPLGTPGCLPKAEFRAPRGAGPGVTGCIRTGGTTVLSD